MKIKWVGGGFVLGILLYPDLFRRKVVSNVELKNNILERVYQAEKLEAEQVYEDYLRVVPKISPFVTDTAEYLSKAIGSGKNVLFEGAQGTLLDVDHGTYPFVTSSNATAGGACTGSGVGPRTIDGVIGIAKAYTTRVGGGPFPTELTDGLGLHIQQKGAEFGASTGRPRRCGWFDAVVVRFASLINHVDTLVITKLDVLDELEEIKICVGYRYRSKRMDFFPTEISVLEQVEPLYESHPGWKTDTTRIQDYRDLPEEAKSYLDRISEHIDREISIISTGPNRAETIIMEENPRLQALF
jgi:adenylosuccinate synthase